MNMDFEYTASIVRAHIKEVREEIPPGLLTKIERFLEADSEDEFWKSGDALFSCPAGKRTPSDATGAHCPYDEPSVSKR